MLNLISAVESQDRLRELVRLLRIKRGFTQAGLAAESGVSLSTLRKFEREGAISLMSYLKLLWALGGLQNMVLAREPGHVDGFNTIKDVLKEARRSPMRQRGWRT